MDELKRFSLWEFHQLRRGWKLWNTPPSETSQAPDVEEFLKFHAAPPEVSVAPLAKKGAAVTSNDPTQDQPTRDNS